MNPKWLGMYIHMHWGYHHPYAARTWTLQDWRGYLQGIAGLGYNLLQIWPMLDSMPVPPTLSDRAHLEKIRQVIDLARDELGMTVWVLLCANTLGNTEAAGYPFESRPYFATERRVNPADPAERRELMEARRVFLKPLIRADGFSIIDSDPGGYEGSPPSEFALLLAEHRWLLDDIRPAGQKPALLNYWMWWGWISPEQGQQLEARRAAWRDVLRGLMACSPEPWGVLACNPDHFLIVEELGLQERALYYPYGVIEAEPSVPFTGNDPERIAEAFAAISPASHPRGVMGNCQSHCLQLPHTYYFAHLAQGRDSETLDLVGFASEVLPGLGPEVAEGWNALVSDDERRLAAARQRLLTVRSSPLTPGRLGGLLFGDPARFLDDLIAQLACKEAVIALRRVLANEGDPAPAARQVLVSMEEWVSRHGFQDYYGGWVREVVNPLLARLTKSLPHPGPLQAVLAEYAALGRAHVAERHGMLARILAGLRASLS